VVEVVAEQPLGSFMQARLFEPLGMVDTGFSVPEEKLERVAVCYRRQGGKLVPTSPGQAIDPRQPPKLESGGGGLFSTADDFARFCRMLLGGGALGEVRVLSEASAAEMMRDQLDGIPAPMLTLTGGAFGLGLAVTTPVDEKGPHSGTVWWGGYAGTGFWIDREADMVGVFMIQNLNEILHCDAFERSVYGALGR
jgi:CubicO group peptidase (beta-lactamase class C family)